MHWKPKPNTFLLRKKIYIYFWVLEIDLASKVSDVYDFCRGGRLKELREEDEQLGLGS